MNKEYSDYENFSKSRSMLPHLILGAKSMVGNIGANVRWDLPLSNNL